MSDTYRILSLDGGGIRGALTAQILHRLTESKPDLIRKFDLIAGTSTGSILACGLASGKIPAEILNLYETEGPFIFKKSGILGFWIKAKYGTKNRLKALQRTFGSKTLGDLNSGVFIATFLLDDAFDPKGQTNDEKKKEPRWKAKFFHNFAPKDGGGDYRGLPVVEVVMRSSAAPLYFPIYQRYIDGGVVANNPSACAYAQVLDRHTPVAAGKKIQILSIGTGDNPEVVNSESGNWGLWQWGTTLLNIVAGGQVGLADYQCKQILGQDYCRVQPDLGANIPLDDYEKIPELLRIANETDLAAARRFVQDW